VSDIDDLVKRRTKSWNPRRWTAVPDEDAVPGEIALWKYFNRPYDFIDQDRPDGGVDLDVEFRYSRGKRWVVCDAKCTKYEKRGEYFLVNVPQVWPRHIYVAALNHPNNIAEITGWIWGGELLTGTCEIRGYRNKGSEAYLWPRDWLRDPEILRRHFTGNCRPSSATPGWRKKRRRIPGTMREEPPKKIWDRPLTGQEAALSRR
jgi:hypothetical protein